MRQVILIILLVLAGTPVVSGQSDDSRSEAERIRERALTEITQRFSVSEAQIDIRVDQHDVDFAGSDSLRIRFSDSGDMPRGRTHVTFLTRSQDQRWARGGWALLFVSEYDSVLVSQDSLRPEEEITSQQIKVIWTDISQFQTAPLTPETFRKLQADDGCLARQHIRKGEIIRRGAVRRPYAARAGASLKMIYERNGISAHLRCKARQSGMAGDIIRVSCPSTGSLYRAQLEEDGTTSWVETL